MIQPSSYEETSARMGEFFLTYMKAMLGDKALLDSGPENIMNVFGQFITDSTFMVGEVDRLRKVLQGMLTDHLPHPGEPGAPVICGYCSMHGARIEWPCGTYKAAQKGLEGNKG